MRSYYCCSILALILTVGCGVTGDGEDTTPAPDAGTDTTPAPKPVPTTCANDSDCDDGNGCTREICLQGGTCSRTADVGICIAAGSGNACKVADVIGSGGCYFTCGDKTCDASIGEDHKSCPADCMAPPPPPPSCPPASEQDDGYSCTLDTCGSDFKVKHVPQSSMCETGSICDPSKGKKEDGGCYKPCGDGTCNASVGETHASCPADCAAPPPPPMCDASKKDDGVACTVDSCGSDYNWRHTPDSSLCKDPSKPICHATKGCISMCGDGMCLGSETFGSCPADCPNPCGNGTCEMGETIASCPADCKAPPPPASVISCKLEGEDLVVTMTPPTLTALVFAPALAPTSSWMIQYGSDAGGGWSGLPYAAASTRAKAMWKGDTETHVIRLPKIANGFNFYLTDGASNFWFDLTGGDSKGGKWIVDGSSRCKPCADPTKICQRTEP
jgi:hypothetical protein